VDSLIDQSGHHTAQDGATVNFTNSIATSYTNVGCVAPAPQLTAGILSNDTTTCQGGSVMLYGSAANYKNVQWRGGTGTFSMADSLHTLYTPGLNETYPVTIRLWAFSKCAGDSVSDTFILSKYSNTTSAGSNVTACAGSSVTLTATGGGTYTWDSSPFLSCTSCASPVANPGSDTRFYVNVTDAHSCQFRDSVLVSVAALPNVSIGAPAQLTCANGSVTLTASSTTGGATFDWGGGNTGANYTVSSPGNYTVTVTDPSSSCTATANTTVTSSGGTVSFTTGSTNATCGNNNGTASVTITSGTSPYGYNWDNGGTTATITGLASGTYNVTVTDAGSCSATASVSVSAGGSLTLQATPASTTCGSSNGSVTVTVTAGTGPYTYAWDNGGTTASITGLQSGTYSVTVTGLGGCSATASAIVGSSSVNPVTISSTRSIFCPGDSEQVCAPNGYASYSWNTGQTTACIYALTAGNYYVTVTDNGNCTVSSNHLSLTVYPVPPVTVTVSGDTLSSFNAVTYQWYFNGNPIQGATSSVYIASQSGNYSVAITDANGCYAISNASFVNLTGINTLSDNNNIRVYPNPVGTGAAWSLETGEEMLGATCEVYDADGKLVWRTEIAAVKTLLDVDVARGIYFMRVCNEHNSYAFKLVKL
ncbi:MAG TPA: T9SS type A sorting domain-containing protein, partial [Chitinophagales bacterium]|nr:T9SS type A sorting domain-containing protein [Chitinophagales bacterium]